MRNAEWIIDDLSDVIKQAKKMTASKGNARRVISDQQQCVD
jgi:hypothetical protein